LPNTAVSAATNSSGVASSPRLLARLTHQRLARRADHLLGLELGNPLRRVGDLAGGDLDALKQRPAELERALRLTPYSRSEFAVACATWQSIEDDVERARRWYVRCRQAFAGSAATVGWGFEVDVTQRGGTRSVADLRECLVRRTIEDHGERIARLERRINVRDG
jgi:hypothetical protein